MASSPKKRIGCWFSALLEHKGKQNASLAAQFGTRAQAALETPEMPASASRRGSLTRDGITLADLLPGECGYISRLIGTTQGRLRLLEMGMTPGTHVQVTRTAAFGGPLDVQVRGYQLSLRRDEAASVRLGGVPDAEADEADIDDEGCDDASGEKSVLKNCEDSAGLNAVIVAARKQDNLG
jgi:ferrous iron transport protein A